MTKQRKMKGKGLLRPVLRSRTMVINHHHQGALPAAAQQGMEVVAAAREGARLEMAVAPGQIDLEGAHSTRHLALDRTGQAPCITCRNQ